MGQENWLINTDMFSLSNMELKPDVSTTFGSGGVVRTKIQNGCHGGQFRFSMNMKMTQNQFVHLEYQISWKSDNFEKWPIMTSYGGHLGNFTKTKVA